MVRFLHWLRDITLGVLNSIAKAVVALILLVLLLAAVGLLWGDGMPGSMVLALDLRDPIADSANPSAFVPQRRATVMDVVLGLDAAARDSRVKGAEDGFQRGSPAKRRWKRSSPLTSSTSKRLFASRISSARVKRCDWKLVR